jgi:hypothetical protein
MILKIYLNYLNVKRKKNPSRNTPFCLVTRKVSYKFLQLLFEQLPKEFYVISYFSVSGALVASFTAFLGLSEPDL